MRICDLTVNFCDQRCCGAFEGENGSFNQENTSIDVIFLWAVLLGRGLLKESINIVLIILKWLKSPRLIALGHWKWNFCDLLKVEYWNKVCYEIKIIGLVLQNGNYRRRWTLLFILQSKLINQRFFARFPNISELITFALFCWRFGTIFALGLKKIVHKGCAGNLV